MGPVARLSTTRVTYVLRDASGQPLAELADDRVNAEVFAAEGRAVELSSWRELEIELAAGTRKLLKQAGRRLVDGGARLSSRPSKFGGLLGDRAAAGPELSPPARPLNRHSRAREVIQAYLSEQAERLIDGGPPGAPRRA